MKKRTFNRFLIDPVALAAACVISLLFASAAHQYFYTAKRNSSKPTNQTIVWLQNYDSPEPIERPDDFDVDRIEKFSELQKNNSPFAVTFDIPPDFQGRSSGYLNGHYQFLAWQPSIPIAHRKLII